MGNGIIPFKQALEASSLSYNRLINHTADFFFFKKIKKYRMLGINWIYILEDGRKNRKINIFKFIPFIKLMNTDNPNVKRAYIFGIPLTIKNSGPITRVGFFRPLKK